MCVVGVGVSMKITLLLTVQTAVYTHPLGHLNLKNGVTDEEFLQVRSFLLFESFHFAEGMFHETPVIMEEVIVRP